MEQYGMQHLCEKMLKYSPDMICALDKDGVFMSVSEASKPLLGYESNELEGRNYISTVHPEAKTWMQGAIREIMLSGKACVFTCRHLHKNGEVKTVSWSIAWSEEAATFFCTGRDATTCNLLNSKASEKTELYQAMMQHGADMMGVIDQTGKYLYVGGGTTRILGYTPEQLIGINAFSLIHPEDITKVAESWSEIGTNEFIKPADFRFKAANGEWKWIETVVSNQLQNPAIKALVLSSRDITERIVSRLRLQESEQRYRALFDNNPDVIYLESIDGTVTEINQAFEDVFGLSPAEVTGKPASFFLPADMVYVNEMSLQQALLGSTMRCDIMITTKDGEHKILDAVKFPVTVNGEIIGVQTIAKDITPIIRSYEVIEQQAKRLNTILESITEAFFTLDNDWRFTYVNSVFARYQECERDVLVGQNIWKVFPRLVSSLFYSKCRESAARQTASHFEESYAYDGTTCRFSIYPSADGLSVFFTDITKKRKMQQELERLSLVASKTNSSVVIADRDWKIEWVNDGFTRLMGYSMEEAVGKRPSELLYNHKTDRTAFESLEGGLLRGEPISFEVLNVRKSGEEVWVKVDITAIFSESGKLTNYVEVQTDITALKKYEQELEKLSLVASHTDNSVIITDACGRTEWVNEGFTRNTGFTIHDLLGKEPVSMLLGAETDSAAVATFFENLKKGIPFNAELINYKKSGDKFWVSMDITPIYNASGMITRYIAIHRDVTQRKEKEAKLMRLTKDLYEHNRDLQKFTYIVSHNLRSPVANALGLANLLTKSDKFSQGFDTTLSYLKTSLLRMDTVLRDMNTVLSVRDRHEVVEKERVRLVEVLRQSLTYLQDSLSKIGAEVSIDADEGLAVSANRSYLFNVFYNLLTNAVKFRSHERPLHIQVQLAGTEDCTVVYFTDNGIGFDTVKASGNIFGLYKKFHRGVEGRGVGLFLVKNYLEAMDGQIEVESQVGIGTRFTIYLA